MKRALLVLLAAAGCKPLEVPQGRYACDPTGNREVGSPQCPGTSRCGLEGYCHAVGETSVWWKCVDATDCESGWQCGIATDGVSRECHDPAMPQDHRCLANADCSGNWTCGLDTARLRRCHDPMKPKAWPCEATSDCVGGWQCGLAATGGRECHDPGKPEAWACLSNDDCLGGWQCGLNDLRTGGECHDPGKPRAFACQRDADCLGGWSCGLNDARTARECHDPNMPRAFSCERPTDCLAGWQCGLNDTRNGGECHDPNMPREFACRDDADCVASWDCGLASNRLQRECHDPRSPRGFACENDADCLGGWRCDVEGTCVDPLFDGLLPVSPLDAGALPFSPVDVRPVEHLAISPRLPVRTREVTVVSTVRGGQLSIRSVTNSGVETRVLDAVVSAHPVGQLWARYNARLDESELVDTPMVYAVMVDGGLTSFELLVDGGVNRLRVTDDGAIAPFVPVSRFSIGMSELVRPPATTGELPYVYGFSSNPGGYVALDGPERLANRVFEAPIDRPGNRIIDFAGYYVERYECLLVVDSEGLWLEDYEARQAFTNAPAFQPLVNQMLGHARCGRTGLRPERFIALQDRRGAFQASPWDGGAARLGVIDFKQAFIPEINSNGIVTCIPDDACTAPLPTSFALGPCIACPAGELVDWTVVTDGGLTAFDVQCGSRDGGSSAFFRLGPGPTPSSCQTRQIVNFSSAFTEGNPASSPDKSPGNVAFSGRNGAIWWGRSVDTVVPTMFDQAAIGVLQRSGTRGDIAAIGASMLGVWDGSLGFTASSLNAPAAVSLNDPRWVVQGTELQVILGATNKVLALATSPLAARPLAWRARTPDGRVVGVVATGNELLSAEVDDSPALVRPPSLLRSRLTFPAPVTSLVFSPGDGGVMLEGYVTSALGLARVTAVTDTSWLATPVALPQSAGISEVWLSHGRTRVGFGDGVVLSLPSRVTVAPRTPDPVEDFLSACNQQFALTARGLFVLIPSSSSPAGSWQPVPLPLDLMAIGLAGGRLHSVGADVYVFTRTGDTARIDLGTCPN